MKAGVDFIGVGVGAILCDSYGRVLLMKRGKLAKNERGLWEFPGGAVDMGETRKQAIVREVREELQINVKIIKELVTLDHLIPRDKQHWVTTLFYCQVKKICSITLLEKGKHDSFAWFHWTDMPKGLSIVTKMIVKLRNTLDLKDLKEEHIRATSTHKNQHKTLS